MPADRLMCGACGSGRVSAPWEDRVGEPGPREPARRAAALTRWLAPCRWRVAAWPGGYTVSGPHGALAPAASVDEVVARAVAARPDLPADVRGADGLTLADAVVRASVASVGAGGPVVLSGPDPGDRRCLHAHGRVDVEVVPRGGVAWSVS